MEKKTFCQGGTLFKTEVLSRGKFLWKTRNFVQGKICGNRSFVKEKIFIEKAVFQVGHLVAEVVL